MKILYNILVGALGLLSLIFLLNPGAGLFFEIPDNFPIIGNLDEAAFTAILIASLAYFGLDVTKLFGKASADAAKKHSKGRREGIIEAETVEDPAKS